MFSPQYSSSESSYTQSSVRYDDYIYIASVRLSKRYLRVGLPALLGLLFLLDTTVRPVMLGAFADAYINVGVFVAATLFLYYAAESYFGFDIRALKQKAAWQQITVAAFLGALPGCGGAIIVVSQYAAGHMIFAALVAVLVATMGDAAFLLLAKSPQIGLLMLALGLGVGIVSGLVVHALHRPDFMRQSPQAEPTSQPCHTLLPIPKRQAMLWLLLLVVALPLTLMSAFQVEVPAFTFYDVTGVFSSHAVSIDVPLFVGAGAAMLCLLMWAFLPLSSSYYRGLVAEDGVAVGSESVVSESASEKNAFTSHNNDKTQFHPSSQCKITACTHDDLARADTSKQSSFSHIIRRVIHDTNFIMVWVMMAFLLFELAVHYTGVSLDGLFTGALWLAPLVGVVVGFLPGCGPQIIIATLYLQGTVPLSTLVGNAISNDGDALFPAIALAPKSAIIATLYSAIPALIVAYAVHFIAR